ncbi:tRNA methyltransferase 10 homolog A [Neocloeon triangulifer]|uniref:tRNA methyltransferase 10 homolog A n=1 Tax=Neocloeon triangulifer TaxID=2078957 RepID=UPI00286F75DA|nr:tRNA methyltransferase 10 homolog A [Neocloeon triangulifer]
MDSESRDFSSDEPPATKIPKIEDDGHGDEGSATSGTLSKSQLKKLRKKEFWEKKKLIIRAKEKEAAKEKRKNDRAAGIVSTSSRKDLKNKTMASSGCNVSVVIDLSFDDKMDKRSIEKCIKQLLRVYSLNRRAENPMQLYFNSLSGSSLQEMKKHQGYLNWDVNISEKSYIDTFDKEKIIYLSSESENILDKLEDDKVYVIGGLVDHNAHKGLCHKLAVEKGIKHAQLPIGEYLTLKGRRVLTIDHVFEILLNVSGGATWKDAFLKIIPKRKGLEEKSEAKEDASDQQ